LQKKRKKGYNLERGKDQKKKDSLPERSLCISGGKDMASQGTLLLISLVKGKGVESRAMWKIYGKATLTGKERLFPKKRTLRIMVLMQQGV